MRNIRLKAAVLALLVSGSVSALAVIAVEDPCGGSPYLQVTVDGADPVMRICADRVGDNLFAAEFSDAITKGAEGDIATFDGSFTADTDPFIAYVFGVTNLSMATTTYTFLFLSPYAAGSYDLIKSSHVSSVTDSDADDGVVVGTSMFPKIHNPMIDGVPSAGAHGDGCTLTPGAGSGPCDSFPLIMAPIAPTAVAGVFGITVKFTLSPGDIYSASGRFELKHDTRVPAPGALAFLGLGLAALGLMHRRRKA